jgi:hypothetical protein
MTTYRGRVQGGLIVFDGKFPVVDGTEVTVLVPDPASTPNGKADAKLAYRIGELAVDDNLPPDLASQHDHYIYGTPKRPKP